MEMFDENMSNLQKDVATDNYLLGCLNCAKRYYEEIGATRIKINEVIHLITIIEISRDENSKLLKEERKTK
jgi:hypothetical protein